MEYLQKFLIAVVLTMCGNLAGAFGFNSPSATVPYPVGKVLVGKVIYIDDGDTLDLLLEDKSKVRIRFADIDAPEVRHGVRKPGQPFGQVAGDFAKQLVAGKIVNVTVVDTDRYGRTVGTIEVNGLNVNQAMVEHGLAWAIRVYNPKKRCFGTKLRDKSVVGLEKTARLEKRGLFADPTPEYPGIYRARVEGDGEGDKATALVCSEY